MSVVVLALGNNRYLITNQISMSPSAKVVVNYPSPKAKLICKQLLANFNSTSGIVTTDLNVLLKLISSIETSLPDSYDKDLDFSLIFSSSPCESGVAATRYYGVKIDRSNINIEIPADFGIWSWTSDLVEESDLVHILETCGYLDLMISLKPKELFKHHYGHCLNVTYESSWFRALIVDALRQNKNFQHIKYMLDLNYLIQTIYGNHLVVCHHYTDPYRLTIGLINEYGDVTLPEFKSLMNEYKLTPVPALTGDVSLIHHSIPQSLIDLISLL